LQQIRSLRKMTVARLRQTNDATRLLRDGDYYIGTLPSDSSPWRAGTSPPASSTQARMLLRAWDIVTFSDFGAAWESADGGGLLITEGMMKALNIVVTDAASAQQLYQSHFYMSELLDGESSKPDAVISHIVEVVAILSPAEEELKVTKSHAPRPHTVKESMKATQRKPRAIL